MKLVAINKTSNPDFMLYLKDSGDYSVHICDQSQKTIFNLSMIGSFKGNFANLLELNQNGIKWAMIQISSGKKNGTWIGDN